MKKKIESIIVLCLVLLVPLIVYADDDIECGPNATWELNGNILRIHGTGKMYNYSSSSDVPWDSYKKDIKSVVIDSGITTIGNYAFSWMPSLSTVIIPNTVTTIGETSFGHKVSLSKLIIPEGVTKIDRFAFSHASIKTIYLPRSLVSIDTGAFYNIGKLTTIYYAGSSSDWNHVSISKSGNSAINDADLICDVPVPINYDLSSMKVITLPSMLEKIQDEAFENLACEAIIIPTNCTSIGSHAFRNCKNLKYVRVSAGTEIAPDAFEGCENVVIDRIEE